MDIYSSDNFHNIQKKEGFSSFVFQHKFKLAILAIIVIGGFVFWQKFIREEKLASQSVAEVIAPDEVVDEVEQLAEFENSAPSEYVYKPGPISMDVMKTKGCVADGILSGYGKDTKNAVAMINRSECLYLHRALETWGSAPDFKKVRKIMEKIDKPGIIYGMFIAENIKKNTEYDYKDKDREFNFRKMCSPGTDNVWGEHTCKPSLKRKEYREYVLYITKQAMDLGIQSFLFGQVYYQDTADIDKTEILGIMVEMRNYAASKGMDIVIGAQTGNIQDEEYMRMFDYIEGGVGMGDDGQLEDGPCWSRMQSCWALLWHEKYADKAHNVFLHLDWSGVKFDDMGVYTRMDKEKRKATLQNFYTYFTGKHLGFMMPLMATLHKENGGCYGPSKGFYSAYNGYKCKDEGMINEILKTKDRKQ